MEVAECEAVLFDLDGVLTPTAEVHMLAWGSMFGDFLAARGGQRPYAEQDYFDFIDGKPRYDGVRSFLESRGIELPEGDITDPAEADTVGGLGNRKNLVFAHILETEGVQPYPGSVDFLNLLDRSATLVAVVSSSRNAPAVLAAAGLADRFEVVIDGKVANAVGLLGKPSPQTFLHAAQLLGVSKEKAAVVEDAISGVEAGRAGDFGLVVGVDRGVGADRLRQAGADLVVGDLAELVPTGGDR